jgi:hypothetical protein
LIVGRATAGDGPPPLGGAAGPRGEGHPQRRIRPAAGIGSPPALPRKTAVEIHDFGAYFGRKIRLNRSGRHGKIYLNRRVDILAKTCFVTPSRAIVPAKSSRKTK